MASKGPKSGTVQSAVNALAKPAAAPAVSQAKAAVAAAPPSVAVTKPVATKPVASTPVVAAKSAPAPAVAKPVSTAAPVAPKPEVAAPVATPAAPAITPQAPPAAPAALTKPAAVAAVTNPVATAALTKKEDIMDAINTATEKTQAQAQAMFADANDRAKSALEKGSKLIEDMNAFSKGNIEAVVESTKIAAKGAEDVARYTSDYAKAAVEKANTTAKQFAAVKSPTELFKLQGDLAKEAMDQMMAETAKFTENYLKLLGEIAQPLSNRVAVAAEKMKIAA